MFLWAWLKHLIGIVDREEFYDPSEHAINWKGLKHKRKQAEEIREMKSLNFTREGKMFEVQISGDE